VAAMVEGSSRPKFGFGFSLVAECGQLCIFGQYSASAKCENYFSAKPSGSAIFCHLALAEVIQRRYKTYIIGVACICQYNTRQSSPAYPVLLQ